MILSADERWIEPGELKKQMVRDRAAVDSGLYDPYGSDFTAYYAYLKDISKDFIKPHAMVGDNDAMDYVLNVEKHLVSLNLDLHGEILDIGCAIGTITNALNQRNKDGKTSGLDISNDAITIARIKYPKCLFYAQAADELSSFPDDHFDMIHAREFYPFTRTDDVDTHKRYLKYFLSKLKPQGIIILSMIKRGKGFHVSYKKLANELRCDLLDLGEHPLMMKIFRRLKLPLWLGDQLTFFTNHLLNRKTSYIWVLRRSSHAQS